MRYTSICLILSVAFAAGCNPQTPPAAQTPAASGAASASATDQPPATGASGSGTEPAAQTPAVAWEIKDGLQAPESAYYDAGSGLVFLSQVVGGTAEKDGKGVISKLDATGKMLKNDWVTGLNAPKGLRSHGGRLSVSDIDVLVGIDIEKGEVAERIEVPGAKFLNDVACGPDGTVYVADMFSSRIHQFKDGKLETFAEGDELESPNGLLVDGDSLVVAAWGLTSDGNTPVLGRLYKLDLATKTKTLITPEPTGNLDGLERDGAGGYLVTDWKAGKVFRISGDGKVDLVLQLVQGTADHAYLADKHLLLLPLMNENTLRAYDLSKQ